MLALTKRGYKYWIMFSFCSLTWPNMAIVNLFHISNKETKPNPNLHILEAKFL